MWFFINHLQPHTTPINKTTIFFKIIYRQIFNHRWFFRRLNGQQNQILPSSQTGAPTRQVSGHLGSGVPKVESSWAGSRAVFLVIRSQAFAMESAKSIFVCFAATSNISPSCGMMLLAGKERQGRKKSRVLAGSEYYYL